MKPRWIAGLVATTTALVTLGLTPSAYAATGDEANSSGQFLSGSLLTGDLSGVAGIDGAQASYIDGTSTPPADEESAGLDLTALSAVGVTIPGGISLPLGDLLSLGAVNQYAWAGPDGVSRAASGAVSDNGVVDTTGTGSFPAGASLDLTQLLGSTNLLSAASLNLQGVTGVAALDGAQGAPLDTTCTDLSAPDNCRDYNIAGATLDLQSPLVGQFTTTVNGATTTLSNALVNLGSTLQTTLGNTLRTALAPLGGTVTVNPSVTIDTTNLTNALSSVLQQTVSSGGVSIDLATGEVTVDLAQLVDLNDLPPNSTLLSPETLQAISAQIASLTGQVQTQLDNILATALDNVSVQISGGASVTVPLVGTAGVTLSYSGSLQDLLDGSSPIGVGTTGLASILQPILGNLGPALQTATTALLPVAQTAVATAGTTIDNAVTTLTNSLSDALDLVANVADVTINVQEENVDGDGTFTETAVRVALLDSDAAQLDLGKAVVGPNIANTYNVTLAATDTPAGQDTTVTGGGWPANTDVTLQMKDPDGNNVGDPITVTTDANGDIPAGTTLPVPADAAPGTYSVAASDAGGETATAPFQVTDETAPEPPVIQTPTDGSSTNDPTPPISGTAEPNSTVDVYEDTDGDGQPDGDPICTATTDGDGNWTCTPTTALGDGDHTIVATATDGSGNVSDPSDPVTFTVDTEAPDAPVITGPEDGSVSSDTTPTITGTGEAGDTVTVTRANGDQVCTATVDADGTWTCDSAELPDGTYTVSATQTDPAGNVSDPSNDVTFTIDTTAPDAPVITGPADGSTISDTTPTITGTGEAGDTVTVTDGAGDTVCTATVDANGNWTCDSEVAFGDGDHTITATQTDPAGNVSDPSDPVTFTVDTTAPAVTIDTVDGEDASAPVATQNTSPPIAGTTEPGATVNVVVTDADGNEVANGPATVDADGNWTFTPGTPLDEGSYTAVATATDEAGNTAQSNTAAFTVDTTAPAAPVITAPTDGSSTNDSTPPITGTGEAGDTVTVVDEDGNTVCTATVATDGTWSCTPETPFTEGDHTITATQTDPAGNTSPASDPVTFTVDTTAPEAPVITSPADGSSTNDSTPDITGTGEPGDTVTVTDETDNATVCTATVQDDGTWTCTPTTQLGDGDHTITATQTDPAGNTSEPSDPVTFTVDTAAPDAPAITSPTDGSTTNDNTPPISGTAEPNSTVDVYEDTDGDGQPDGDPICSATTDGDGHWACTPTTALDDGDHTIVATATDDAGNTSAPSDPVTVTIDATAPDAPVIATVDGQDATGPVVTNDSTPTVSGTGEAGDTVTVTDEDGNTVCTTTVDSDGNWSCDAGELSDGDHTLTATQTDAAGNVSEPSDPVQVTVDTAVPDAPVIESPADGSTITERTPTVNGTGEPGDTVNVSIDGTQVGTATVDEDGNWTLALTDPLTDGDHTVSATQTDPAGNTSDAASNDFTVDATAPDAPVITGPTDGSSTGDNTPTITGTGDEPGNTITVTDGAGDTVCTATVGDDGTWSCDSEITFGDGDHTITATETDPSGNISDPSAPVTFTVDTVAPDAPIITGPADGSTTSDTTPAVSGTAEPNSTVAVYEDTDGDGQPDGDPICTATANVDGNWTCTPTTALDEGDHTIVATATDDAGNTSGPSDPVTFTIDTTAPAVEIDTVAGNDATSPSSTQDRTPAIAGKVEGATGQVTVTVTDSDGIVVATGQATADADGNWTFTPTTDLANGNYTAVATATDDAGNTGSSNTAAFSVYNAAPVITGPADGSTVTDNTPTISGTGEPGSTVTVREDGDTVCTAAVQDDGTWSCSPATPLDDGDHTITATQTDAAGNTSPASDPIDFTVDSTAPAPPVITSPSDGDTVTDNTPTITGNGGDAGDTITVTDEDGNTVCTATVNENGTWSCTPDSPLSDGDHTITATETDPAGNTSAPSDPVDVTVDSTVSDPTITGPADGSTITDRTPTITGTGEPGATITVRVDGQVLGTVKVAKDGTWSLPVTDQLAYGSHTVRAVQRDAAGNVSDAVTSTFTVAPAAPVITSPGDGDTVSATPTVKGTGKPGAQVTVYVDGKAVGAATVSRNGHWKANLPELTCGKHSIAASQGVDTTSARVARATVHGRVQGRAVTSAMSAPVTVHVACPSSEAAVTTAANTGAGTGAGTGSTLPNTGAPAGLAALIGLGLGCLATGVLILARRRRDA